MSSALGMKIIRQTRSGKFEELCNLDYFNKIKNIVDYMDEFTISYPDQLKKFMQDKEASYEVFNINSFKQFVNLANNNIEDYKKRIAELKENLKAYYQGGKYCPEIEEDLREEISTYEELIGKEGKENSYDDNWYFNRQIGLDIIEDIDFVSEYLKPEDYKDPEENLYIIIPCWW